MKVSYLQHSLRGCYSHQLLLVDQEDGSVGLEIDSVCLLDDLKSFDRDVFLVGQTEADNIEHIGSHRQLSVNHMLHLHLR